MNFLKCYTYLKRIVSLIKHELCIIFQTFVIFLSALSSTMTFSATCFREYFVLKF